MTRNEERKRIAEAWGPFLRWRVLDWPCWGRRAFVITFPISASIWIITAAIWFVILAPIALGYECWRGLRLLWQRNTTKELS